MANCSHSDTSESDIENVRENSKTDDESDISISSVKTEDLSELEFLEDDEDGEIGWSRDPAPVNVTYFHLEIWS